MTQRYFYRPFSDLFDQVLDEFSSGVSTLSNSGVYDTKFPPCNIFMEEETLDLDFEFALAGFTLEEIDMSFEDDYLILKVKPNKEGESERKRETIRHTISRRSSIGKYYVPFSKYDTEKTTASFENGILKVHVPAKEERKSRKVKIQG